MQIDIQETQINITIKTLPKKCKVIIINLPDGKHLISCNQADDKPFTIDDLDKAKTIFIEYLDVCEHLRETTLKGYRVRLGQIVNWFGTNQKYVPSEKNSWIAYYGSLKKRGQSVYSQIGHYHILNRFGRWLTEQGYLIENPMDGIFVPKTPKTGEPKAIFKEHIKKMIATAKSSRDKAVLLFFRDTACRATEAISLTWGDVFINDGKAIVTGKGGKVRNLFFKPLTARALRKYRETVPHKKKDPVWVGEKGTLGYNGIYKIFYRLAEDADLLDENFNPHAWRHAFGRDTTKKGMPTAQLQDIMGHSSMKVTKIYAQFNTAELQEAHDLYSPVDDDLGNLQSDNLNTEEKSN